MHIHVGDGLVTYKYIMLTRILTNIPVEFAFRTDITNPHTTFPRIPQSHFHYTQSLHTHSGPTQSKEVDFTSPTPLIRLAGLITHFSPAFTFPILTQE